MCGFAGIVDFTSSDLDRNKRILSEMGETLKLRGPDEQNMYQDDVLSFVFRRLSIVDLEGGSQPIWNEDESIFVSVNGEIYNHQELRNQLPGHHRFRTNSDSEIVLHLYEAFGADAFSMLNGMFSLVIWDKNKQQLIMARDRLGIKPLYYSLNEDRLLFGSELKALLVHPDCPRELKWSDLEQVGVQQKSEVSSYIEGVHHFPAGHYSVWQPDKPFTLNSYWDIRDSFKPEEKLTVSDIEKNYDEILEDAVRKRLMADVPVGLFLSGGIDSSLIAALLAKYNANVHCFTVVEKSTYQSGDVENAKKVTESLGLPFYPVLFDLEDMAQKFQLADLERMVALIESPRFDPEWYFKSELHRTAKAEVPDIKVMLLGQGADEFAGGYSKYLGSEWRHWDDYIVHSVKPSLKRFEQENKGIPDRLIQGLADENIDYQSVSPYQQKMKALTYQLQYFNLWHEDRSSAYHGIESRVPFLDHRLVELLASVPEKHHQTLFWDKKLVRDTLRKHLSDYPDNHKKVPFFVTDKKNSIQKFIIDITNNIYPTFITEYINQSKSQFEKEDMDELYSKLSKYNQQSEMAAWYLLERMSITIFQSFCRDIKQFLEKSFFNSRQPLPVIKPDQWQAVTADLAEKTEGTSEWTINSVVNIQDGFRIMNPLTEDDHYAELVLNKQNTNDLTIKIPDEQNWIVMLLDEMGRHVDEPKSIEYWSQRTNKPPAQIVDVFHNLVNGGFLERVG